ncbi:hypothetical protein ElyMa_001672500 [Elysia marginata]|uniref:Uncharacterized protein n=1 Tax=Elysia marginata TaxID=1093978 RepID=A0AAV4JS92_9GAST|nr:hypothetical protein ElyMa_001672500 [Elysia marginata]
MQASDSRSDRGRDRDSPHSDDEKEYRPGVQAIVDAVRSSRRFKSRKQSISEEGSAVDNKTGSNYMSPEIDSSMSSSSGDWRMLSQRYRQAAALRRKGKKVTPVERRRRLEDMRDREDVAAYNKEEEGEEEEEKEEEEEEEEEKKKKKINYCSPVQTSYPTN